MKPTLLITTLALCLTSGVWLKAQDADTSTPPDSGGGHHHWGPQMSDADRAKVKAAYDSAMQNNPDLKSEGDTLKQQEEDFHKKLHDAMVAADPSVEPLLAKMHHHMPPPDGGTPPPADGQ
jgi:hypothetical protein